MGRALTVAERAQRMDLNRETICMCVRRLLDLGLLERSGRHKSRAYKTVAGATEPPDRRGHRRGTDQEFAVMPKREHEQLLAARQAAADTRGALDRANARIRELERNAELVNTRLGAVNEERDQYRWACHQLEARLASSSDPER